jgi:outer membrane lipoprotein carrier protein
MLAAPAAEPAAPAKTTPAAPAKAAPKAKAAPPPTSTPATKVPASASQGKPSPTRTAKPASAAVADAVAGVAGPAGTLPLDKVIARMQERYDSASDYRAKFTQKYTYAASGRERTSSGEIFIKKPGRMRWNYEKPEPSLWLATGSTFWMYEPEAKQAFKQDLKASQLPAAVAFLTGKGKLTDEFDVTVAKELPYGTAEDYRLSLRPKKPQSQYRSIYFVVDPKTFLVRQSVLINAQGDINAISFDGVALNTKLGDDLFRWTPPADVRVIDGASLSKPEPRAAAPKTPAGSR